MIAEKHPRAVLAALSPFCGAYAAELEALCKSYSEKHGRTVHFINGGVWIPAEPLHPLRGGHKIVAEHLIPALKAIIDEEK